YFAELVADLWDYALDLVLDGLYDSRYGAHGSCYVNEFLYCLESKNDLFKCELASHCDPCHFPYLCDLVGVHCAPCCVLCHLCLDAFVEEALVVLLGLEVGSFEPVLLDSESVDALGDSFFVGLLVVGSTIRFWFICEPENLAESCVFLNLDLEVSAKIGCRSRASLTESVILFCENRSL